MNKKHIVYLSFLSIITLGSTLLNAYYYQASHWVKDSQTLILIRDRHSIPSGHKQKYLDAINTQRKDLLNFLESTESMTIVEDLDVYTLELADKLDTFLDDPISYDPNSNNGFSIDELLPQLQTIVTPLVGFTQCCHASDIPVVDVDFRFFCLDSLQDNLTTKDAYKLCKKTIAEIEAYNDSERLTALYQKQLSKIKPYFKSYKTFYNQIMNKYMPTDHINRLIDLKILHQIHTNDTYNVIVVLAGGAHIGRIEGVLPQLGFRKKSSSYKTGMAEAPMNLKSYFRPFLA